jgi:quinoprotein glucose dehydrogenase
MIRRIVSRVLAIYVAGFVTVRASGQDRDWPVYLGDNARSHYSPLDQVNRNNVGRLAVAWTFRSGDVPAGVQSQIQCSPLVVGRTLYGATPMMSLFALDAATGRELWRFDPRAGQTKAVRFGQKRGMVYWADGDDRRIYCAVENYLYAVNARDGQPIASFGERGRTDLKAALGPAVSDLPLVSNTPGVVFEDLIIMPTRVSEANPAAPGHICAYDLRTGKLRWMFQTIPNPGEFGYDTWPADAWQRTGGANCWAGMALDAERGLVFIPTGSATSDFWGGDRAGANLFANCLLCLDARTGKRVWHYQIVHHDIWDRDLPAPPNLVTLRRGGKTIPAVAQMTKHGHVFVFHRETGEPLFPIEERPVPPSDVPGESAWRTQPFPSAPAPFSRQVYTYDLLPDLTPAGHREALERFAKLKPHAPFMPFSREGTIAFPGLDGGAEWGGVGAAPECVLYVNASDTPWIMIVRAFDRDTGKELWRAKRPAAGYATPITYQIDGRQYFVIACGGGKLGTPSGDTYVAFAAPRN